MESTRNTKGFAIAAGVIAVFVVAINVARHVYLMSR